MKKPILNLILLGFLTFSLFSCGGSEEKTEEVNINLEEATEEIAEEPDYDKKTFVFVTADVVDFTKWEKVYLEKSDKTARMGYSVNVDKESTIGVAEFTNGHDAAREKFADQDMKIAMMEAGVISIPQMTFLNTVWMTTDQPKGAYRIAVKHEISDMAQWRTAFDADKVNREKAGMFDICIASDESNDNLITVVIGTDDLEACKAVMKDPKVGEMMKKAGVVGEPEKSYWKVINE